MELLEQIDNYVLQSAEVKKLQSEIDTYKRSEFYASVEGDLSYHEGDYNLEKQYNASVRFNQQKREEAEKKLEVSAVLLQETKGKLQKLLSGISEYDLASASGKISSKIQAMEGQLALLRKRIKTAYINGDKAYIAGDYKKEKEYNAEYRRLYDEITSLTPILEGYQEALSILGVKHTVSNDDFQPGNE